MITERTARISPAALAQYHTRSAPADVRWIPAEHLFDLENEIIQAINQPRGRLAISLPPRFGKTTLLRYVMAHHLGQRPDDSLMYITHSSTKAAEEGAKVRSIAVQTYAPVFGLELAHDSAAKDSWKLQGHQGGARFTGTDGDLMGRGFNLGIVDDPAGKIDEIYNSDAWSKLMDWYESVFLSRAEPGATVILVMHRWATDDLIGRLVEETGDAWKVVNYPAIKDGASLWPQRWSLEELEAIKKTKTGRIWEAQYLGRPTPEGGALYNPSWTAVVPFAPNDAQRCRCWDLASSKNRGDFTAGARVSVVDLPAEDDEGEAKFYIIEDVVRKQASPAEVEAMIRRTAEDDGRWVSVGIEIEPGSSGRLYFEHMCGVLSGFDVFPVFPSGSKESRWLPMLAAAEHGALALLEGDWNKAFIAELERLPGGKHDDQVDAAASTFTHLSKKAAKGRPMLTVL